MSTGLHIYIDVDDVLAQTTRSIQRMAARMFGTPVEFEEMHTFDLAESLALSPGEYDALMDAAHDHDFLTSLEPMSGSAGIVSHWQAAGARIGIVTGRPPSAREATECWLEMHAIPFDDLDFVDKYGRYDDAGALSLQALGGRAYQLAIEDSIDVAAHLATLSGTSVALFDRPWNQSRETLPEGVTRVHSWLEIEAIAQRLG